MRCKGALVQARHAIQLALVAVDMLSVPAIMACCAASMAVAPSNTVAIATTVSTRTLCPKAFDDHLHFQIFDCSAYSFDHADSLMAEDHVLGLVMFIRTT